MRSDDERRTIRELGLRQWLSGVVWYHYKWWILGILGVVTALTVAITLQNDVPEADLIAVVAVSDVLPAETLNSLKLALGDIMRDQNGDGKIVINLLQYEVNPKGTEDQYNQEGRELLINTFINDVMVLYLFDQTNRDIYLAPGQTVFNEDISAEFGATGAAVPLGDAPWAAQLGLTGEKQLYAGFKIIPFLFRDKWTPEEFYAAPRKAVAGLLTYGFVLEHA